MPIVQHQKEKAATERCRILTRGSKTVISLVETLEKPANTASAANNSITIMYTLGFMQQKVIQVLLQVVLYKKEEQASECCRMLKKVASALIRFVEVIVMTADTESASIKIFSIMYAVASMRGRVGRVLLQVV